MRGGFETGRQQHFRYEELRSLWTDGERLDHHFLEHPSIGCPQLGYTKSLKVNNPANGMGFETLTETTGGETCEWLPKHGGCWKVWLASIILSTSFICLVVDTCWVFCLRQPQFYGGVPG